MDHAEPGPRRLLARASSGPEEPALEAAFEEGRAAALAREEAAPGCTTTPAGRAWLAGYTAGAAERAEPPRATRRNTAVPARRRPGG